ncbi:MAG: PAS domain S-box protein [Oleiphilaceae bacterium]|nr:PAS domain S-box protein [Oleiphilaceae bacterium]
MLDFFSQFLSDAFMPHGYCYNWRQDILWTNVISDSLIAAAYFSIPIALMIFLRRRRDLQFRGIFALFAMFIMLCGLTHVMGIYTVWYGTYGLHGIVKAMTAFVSMYTAFVVFKNLEAALAIPTREQLEQSMRETAEERVRNERLEVERQAEAIFRFTTELMPAGLLVIDHEQTIVVANEALANLFGYEKEELVGANISILLSGEMNHHQALVSRYLEQPTQHHEMAAGRVVQGRHKSGKPVEIQISLSVHEFEGTKHAFATVIDFNSFGTELTQFNESSNRVKRAIDASNDGIWEWNIPANKVWYSPRLIKMIGGREDDPATFAQWKNHIHQDDWPRVESALEAHIERGEKYDLTYRGLAESGKYEWFHTRGDSIADAHGKPFLMSGTLTNINEIKLLEARLADQTRFLDQVLQRSLTGLYIFDLQTYKNIFINAEYTNLTGYTLAELESVQQSGLIPLFHPDDEVRIYKHFNDVINAEFSDGVGIEYRFRHKDGQWRWFYSRDSVYSYDDFGKPKEMLGAFFDITDLKRREEEIRALAIEYSATFEQAAVGIAHITADGEVCKVNSRLCVLLGYDKNELEGAQIEAFAQVGDNPHALRDMLFAMAEGQNIDTECHLSDKAGATIAGHLTISRVERDVGELRYVCVVEDISERKEIENKLSESNASLERFAYSASHDLQEPLRKIAAFSGALERRLKDQLQDKEALFQLERICDASLRMSEMIDKLLQLSRAARQALDLEEVQLSEVLNLAAEDMSEVIEANGAKLILEADATVCVDKHAFSQVLRNLIANSINYRDQTRPPHIRIRGESRLHGTRVIVSDNGTGFKEADVDQIFEPFRRLVGMTVPGTGMGLTICRQIIQAHGGSITARPLSRGASFIIELPALRSA